jgi:hypothetical protein
VFKLCLDFLQENDWVLLDDPIKHGTKVQNDDLLYQESTMICCIKNQQKQKFCKTGVICFRGVAASQVVALVCVKNRLHFCSFPLS